MAQDVRERPERVLVGAHVDPAARVALQEIADQEETSVAAVVRRAIRAELDRADKGEET